MAKRLKLFGITYLVGKIKFKLLFQGPLAKWGFKEKTCFTTKGFAQDFFEPQQKTFDNKRNTPVVAQENLPN